LIHFEVWYYLTIHLRLSRTFVFYIYFSFQNFLIKCQSINNKIFSVFINDKKHISNNIQVTNKSINLWINIFWKLSMNSLIKFVKIVIGFFSGFFRYCYWYWCQPHYHRCSSNTFGSFFSSFSFILFSRSLVFLTHLYFIYNQYCIRFREKNSHLFY